MERSFEKYPRKLFNIEPEGHYLKPIADFNNGWDNGQAECIVERLFNP